MRWDDALPREDRWLADGRLPLLFCPRVESQPLFMRGTRVAVHSARGMDVFGPEALRRTLRVVHLGAAVQYNVGAGNVVPFVCAGGGVMLFDPDSGDVTRRIAVLAVGGLRFDLGGVRGELFAEHFRFRLAPEWLFGGAPDDPDAHVPVLRNNA